MIDGKSRIIFGSGDICVNAGMCEEDGFIAFTNQAPREIGTEGIIKANQEVDSSSFDVVINFTKTESIDVVIKALNIAKKLMLEETK